MLKNIAAIEKAEQDWQPPVVPDDIPQGDMPGDKVWIGPKSIQKVNTAFRTILPMLKNAFLANKHERCVISVSGGSGVGKTCVSALLAFYLNEIGISAYTLSGDNYPHRFPQQNDDERMRIFRLAGVRGMLAQNVYTAQHAAALKELQQQGTDCDPSKPSEYPWLHTYQAAGQDALMQYLGTGNEQEYGQLENLLKDFKDGKETLWLKRLGREATDLWYEEKDFSQISVIVLEWTHGNSGLFEGVDIPILLSSTPAETREYRLMRGRDANADTPFITMVIELEQLKLEARAEHAKVIISKSGELLSYPQYKAQMDAGR